MSAPIDSAVKAAVVASIERGIGVSCERSVRTTEGGFEVHLVTESCFGACRGVVGVGLFRASSRRAPRFELFVHPVKMASGK
ncbi:MAG: hypothetical protein Q8L48_38510 [Archangium sp.]|nr:hypothetical protein [Archangium sp.]